MAWFALTTFRNSDCLRRVGCGLQSAVSMCECVVVVRFLSPPPNSTHPMQSDLPQSVTHFYALQTSSFPWPIAAEVFLKVLLNL